MSHELGHALIHVLELPITGREEDAADQLATLLLVDGSQHGLLAAAAAAQWFGDQSVWFVSRGEFADEHGLNQQRYYNILCWTYGANPTAHAELLAYVPAARAQRCPAEYAQMQGSWERLMAPWETAPASRAAE